MQKSKKAFTMIELIFVIVILGILAAVAIPKLAATRDDAVYSKDVANIKTCINDTVAKSQATGTMTQATVDAIPSCSAAVSSTANTITATYTVPNLIIAGSPDVSQNIAYRVSGNAVTR